MILTNGINRNQIIFLYFYSGFFPKFPYPRNFRSFSFQSGSACYFLFQTERFVRVSLGYQDFLLFCNNLYFPDNMINSFGDFFVPIKVKNRLISLGIVCIPYFLRHNQYLLFFFDNSFQQNYQINERRTNNNLIRI